MKSLEQFFESENDKTTRPTKKDEGMDDKKYIALMNEYKILRRQRDRKKANEILKKAQELAKTGDVSSDAKLGGAYL